MPKVYALLVGINKYQASPLSGCVADIDAIETLLTERMSDALDLVTLRDEQATREGIIRGFQTHLRRAGAKDIALFYFCGHGSREPVPLEWRRLEPSGKNQTLVAVDSRTNGVYDLADKEVSALIHEVAAGGAEVVVITDCCHSSGNTRGDDGGAAAGPNAGVARTTPAATSGPKVENYLPLAQELYAPDKVAEEGPPQPRHIAIAACQDTEEAKEFPKDSVRRGAFSLAFEETVRALGPSATYVDIVNAVKMKVRDRAVAQVPSLYVAGGASGRDLFLAGASGRIDLTIDSDESGRWWLSQGAVDGIPSPAAGDVTEVAIYERGAFDDVATSAPAPLATAVVAEVLADRARLNPSPPDALEAGAQYLGAITQLGGAAALHVLIETAEGADEAAARVRDCVTASSPLIDVVDRTDGTPRVTLAVSRGAVQVKGADGAPLEGLDYPLDDAGLDKLTAACIHLASWYQVRDLEPTGSRLNGYVHIELVPVPEGEPTAPDDAEAHAASDGSLSLPYADGKGPRVQCRLRNLSKERLYVALLGLTDSFASAKQFADWIPAGGTGYLLGGKALRLSIPTWRDPSVRSVTDYFKVVAAIEDFDPERWTLPALLGKPKERGSRGIDADEPAEVLKRPADGVDAFWGTTLLKVETTR